MRHRCGTYVVCASRAALSPSGTQKPAMNGHPLRQWVLNYDDHLGQVASQFSAILCHAQVRRVQTRKRDSGAATEANPLEQIQRADCASGYCDDVAPELLL